MAFLLNLHNFTILYGLCISPPHKFPQSAKDWANYSKSLRVKVADYTFTPYEIQHSLLRVSMTPPDDPEFAKEYLKKMPQDLKARFKCAKPEALINFGFYYPYQSSPFLNIFTAENLPKKLAEIAQLCLVSCKYNPHESKLTLPGFISLYKEDFLLNKYNKNFITLLKSCLFESTDSKYCLLYTSELPTICSV
eukprot:TRINITY_DN26757_c0_g1_i1.p1 TRINITY_DN26757_c0_g1~~TRINITY_DN26757_c0_g1_i1.p1  ORF type:complete len:193 (-),score=39.70 TRINITY_DN26757_c0_g1_i1:42-620(-)